VKPVIISADDFAMDAAVDEAILDLARRGVVTATAAMVWSPRWAQIAPAARELADSQLLDCGLHLDFTSPLADASGHGHAHLPLLLQTVSHTLAPKPIRRSIELQLDRFEQVYGQRPRFIDGHHHVHQLPVIREQLLAALVRRYPFEAQHIGLRWCHSQPARGSKAALIGLLGAKGLKQLAEHHGLCTNTDFSGVYDFSPAASLPRLWRDWLSTGEGAQPLVMCHVARDDGTLGDTRRRGGDSIRAARIREYEWLRSAAFDQLLTDLQRRPARWQ